MRRPTLIALALVALSGCATTADDQGRAIDSTTGAGINAYRSEPVFAAPGEVEVGKKVELVLGKEVGTARVRVDLACENGDPIRLELDATDVRAFEGQATAASAIVAIRQDLTEAQRVTFDTISSSISRALEAYLATISPGLCVPTQ